MHATAGALGPQVERHAYHHPTITHSVNMDAFAVSFIIIIAAIVTATTISTIDMISGNVDTPTPPAAEPAQSPPPAAAAAATTELAAAAAAAEAWAAAEQARTDGDEQTAMSIGYAYRAAGDAWEVLDAWEAATDDERPNRVPAVKSERAVAAWEQAAAAFEQAGDDVWAAEMRWYATQVKGGYFDAGSQHSRAASAWAAAHEHQSAAEASERHLSATVARYTDAAERAEESVNHDQAARAWEEAARLYSSTGMLWFKADNDTRGEAAWMQSAEHWTRAAEAWEEAAWRTGVPEYETAWEREAAEAWNTAANAFGWAGDIERGNAAYEQEAAAWERAGDSERAAQARAVTIVSMD